MVLPGLGTQGQLPGEHHGMIVPGSWYTGIVHKEPVLCHSAPLGVVPEYQELVDMGLLMKLGLAARGRKDYDYEIPWGTDPRFKPQSST